MASRLTECAIEIRFDRRDDGRFHILSPDLPGFHLVGPDLDMLRADVEPVLRDILRLLTNQSVDTMMLIPTLEQLRGHLHGEHQRELRRVTFRAPT